MAQAKCPPELIQQAVDLVNTHGSVGLASRACAIPYGTLRHRYMLAGKTPSPRQSQDFLSEAPAETDWTENPGTDTASLKGRYHKSIRTPEQLYEAFDIDGNVWEVTKLKCRAWTTAMKLKYGKGVTKPHQEQNYAVAADFKRRFPRKLGSAIDLLVGRIPKFQFSAAPYAKSKSDPHLLELGLNDVHVGKLAWAMEAGESYDLKIAEFGMRTAVDDVLRDSSAIHVEKILVPIGQDFFHFDNLIGMSVATTTGGTPQDVDGRWAKVFEVGISSMIHVAMACLKRAPVKFVWIPGNHDFTNSYWLSRVIQEHFRDNRNVEVDVSPKSRKYIHYGPTLLGLTHGSEERHQDLPTIMASEEPQAWAQSTHREWHLGHFHKSKETRFGAGDTFGGVRVKILPALCRTDAWHYKKGYVGNTPAMESYLWSKTRGFRGFFNTNAAMN